MTTKDSTENMPDVRNIAEPDCPICHGNGVYCIGTSGSHEDGNCPILEGCDCVTKYYSQAELDRRVADVKENLTVEDIKAWADGIHACPDELKDRVTEEEASIAHLILNPNAVAEAEERQREKDAKRADEWAEDVLSVNERYYLRDAILNAGVKDDE